MRTKRISTMYLICPYCNSKSKDLKGIKTYDNQKYGFCKSCKNNFNVDVAQATVYTTSLKREYRNRTFNIGKYVYYDEELNFFYIKSGTKTKLTNNDISQFIVRTIHFAYKGQILQLNTFNEKVKVFAEIVFAFKRFGFLHKIIDIYVENIMKD